MVLFSTAVLLPQNQSISTTREASLGCRGTFHFFQELKTFKTHLEGWKISCLLSKDKLHFCIHKVFLVITNNSLDGGKLKWLFILNKHIRHLEIQPYHKKLLNLNIWTDSQSTSISEARHTLSKLDEDFQHTYQWFQFHFYSWLLLSCPLDNQGSIFSHRTDQRKAERIL